MTTQEFTSSAATGKSFSVETHLPGAGQAAAHAQGHWVLARLGKRVLRPGGLELTRQMLHALNIGPEDRVVEFAPGFGVTAKLVLARNPKSYWGVEREPAAVRSLRQEFSSTGAQILEGSAEESALPDASASIVYSEALMTMQPPRVKSRLIEEAHRILTPGGRYGMHEICLLPGGISDSLRQEIQATLSREIHVGVQPLCEREWAGLLEQHGMKPVWKGSAPMRLLRVERLLQDEGLLNCLRIGFRVATQPVLGSRVRAMRRLFERYRKHLGAISIVAERVK